MEKRAEAARVSEESKGKPLKQGGADVLRYPDPLRVPGILSGLPWDYVQDQIGVLTTDIIAFTALLLTKYVQDQIRAQGLEKARDTRKTGQDLFKTRSDLCEAEEVTRADPRGLEGGREMGSDGA